MGFMDLARARAAVAEAELDALLILSPRHVYYATGYRTWFLTMYAEAGYGAAIVPADPARAPGAVVTDVEEGPFRETAPEFTRVVTFPAWVAYADVPPLAGSDAAAHLSAHRDDQPSVRAGQIDRNQVMQATADLMQEMGLARGRIGIEGSFISAWADHWLSAALPEATFIDAQGILEELRAIKSPRELDLLRRGTRLAEGAIQGIAGWLKPGATAGEIGQFYRSHVLNNADGGDVTSARITLRTGRDVLSPRSASTHVTAPGDVIFLDCGVEVGGYWADIGRTAVLGDPSPTQRQIYGILRDGFAEATALIEPGRPVADLFTTGLSAVRRKLPRYTRGNLGHGVGLHPAPELPIVSAEETRRLTPGHVLSVEFPYYIGGIGAFTVEDTFAIGEKSVEVLNQLSHDLIEIEV